MNVRAPLGRVYRTLLAPLHFQLSRAELKQLLPGTPASSALWRAVQSYRGAGWYRDISPWQVESEYCRLVDWLVPRRPRTILEIGTAKGATLLAWSRIATELVISVDLPGGIHGGGYPAPKARLYREFVAGRSGVELRLYRGDSHSEALRDDVAHMLGGRGVDFLFIDGDHTYAGARRDFDLWSPLVAPGGHVAFHDIVAHRVLPDCQVDLVWNELKPLYDTFELIADPQQGWAGIGVLRMPGKAVI